MKVSSMCLVEVYSFTLSVYIVAPLTQAVAIGQQLHYLYKTHKNTDFNEVHA